MIIGIDGGGSKTEFKLFSLEGKLLAGHTVPAGVYYPQDGVAAVAGRLRQGAADLTEAFSDTALTAIGFGMPGYGEGGEEDIKAVRAFAEVFAPCPIFAENDVYCALEGAFCGGPGILIVAGTGAMAYGRGEDGSLARCGGWSEFFGDEGSAYWLGLRALELFSKEADGRLPRSALYTLMMEHFGLSAGQELEILSKAGCAAGDRRATARLQLLLKEAALMGDRQALAQYERAVSELCALAEALREKLGFSDAVPVSWAGSLFKAEDLVLEPMKKELGSRIGAVLKKPALDPCSGAALNAAEKLLSRAQTEVFLRGLLSNN